MRKQTAVCVEHLEKLSKATEPLLLCGGWRAAPTFRAMEVKAIKGIQNAEGKIIVPVVDGDRKS